jgi:hypothetical protein
VIHAFRARPRTITPQPILCLTVAAENGRTPVWIAELALSRSDLQQTKETALTVSLFDRFDNLTWPRL